MLILKQNNQNYGFLLHNTNRRYQDINNNYFLPIKEGTLLFTTDADVKVVPNVATTDTMDLYQGNNEPEKHAITWLKSKRGIKCQQAGAYLAEYNLRFYNSDVNVAFCERFYNCLITQYKNIFEQNN